MVGRTAESFHGSGRPLRVARTIELTAATAGTGGNALGHNAGNATEMTLNFKGKATSADEMRLSFEMAGRGPGGPGRARRRHGGHGQTCEVAGCKGPV